MQGTIVMLMALSGLGCHHKECDVAYVARLLLAHATAALLLWAATAVAWLSACYGGSATA